MRTAGSRLGRYELLDSLGAGGMGEVFRARDAKLGREIALKVLPEKLALDAQRRARFEREARLLGSLSHPNIAMLFGLEESDGVQMLALELIEGETLAERLTSLHRARTRLPMDEAVAIADQIAAALEAAHERGVVHRDLKPSNVALMSDGTVKVLDFGLAKVLDPQQEHVGEHAPTISDLGPPGAALGTPAYMSPEQARGLPVDKRTDIWAFGCVLFEMLAGERAFAGETSTDVIAKVLEREPAFEALPADVAPSIGRLLRRCLEKDPRRRLRDIGDARLELAESRAPSARPESPAVATVPPAAARALSETRLSVGKEASGSSRLLRFCAAAAVAVVVGVTGWFLRPLPAPEPKPVVSRLAMLPTGATALRLANDGHSIAISPDGSRVAYLGADSTLWVRALDELESTVLVRSDNAPQLDSPFFSPDGQWIGYFLGGDSVRRVHVSGGPSSLVTRHDYAAGGGATWAEDGTLVFGTLHRSTGLYRHVPDGAVDVLTTPNRDAGEADHLWPEVLPGDRAVLFTITALSGRPEDAQVAVLDLDTGHYHAIVPRGSHAHYVPMGYLTYSAAGELRAVAFSLDRLATTGLSVPVERPVAMSHSLAAEFDVADNGTLIYVPAAAQSASRPEGVRRLVWVNRDQDTEPLEVPQYMYMYPRISNDGDRVLLDIRDRDNDIWLLDVQSGSLANLTRHPALDRFPIWEPDGDHFIFVSDREDGQSVILRLRIGADTPETLSDPWPTQQTPNAVSPDGSQLVFDRDDDLFMLALDGSRHVTPLAESPYLEGRAVLSPDGRWIAYHGNESGRMEIFVRPFPNVDDGKEQVSGMGGSQPWWSRAGDELFYFAPTGQVMGVRVGSGADWSGSAPAVVLEANDFLFSPSPAGASTFDVTGDGQRFLMVQRVTEGDTAPRPIVVVQHWDEELKRLMSTE